MIVLDTNVLSEPLKSMPTPKVMEWLDYQAADTLFLTTISRAELRVGVLKMPEGGRKNALAANIEQVLVLFKNRTFDFNAAPDHTGLRQGKQLGSKPRSGGAGPTAFCRLAGAIPLPLP
jgi:predicted nucleic acid-binding protein